MLMLCRAADDVASNWKASAVPARLESFASFEVSPNITTVPPPPTAAEGCDPGVDGTAFPGGEVAWVPGITTPAIGVGVDPLARGGEDGAVVARAVTGGLFTLVFALPVVGVEWCRDTTRATATTATPAAASP
jgi:hypothetical protein